MRTHANVIAAGSAHPVAPLPSALHGSLRQHTSSLRSHLAQCPAIGSMGLRLRCLFEEMHGALAPRLFTTVALASSALAAVLVANSA